MATLRHVEVLSASKGLFAASAIAAGDLICALTFERIERSPSRHTVQIGEQAHARPMPQELASVNHSCAPNVIFDVQRMVLRALRDIDAGEELRYFYPSTEWEMAEPFECDCGADRCLGVIEGASRVNPEILRRYELAPHIEARLAC